MIPLVQNLTLLQNPMTADTVQLSIQQLVVVTHGCLNLYIKDNDASDHLLPTTLP
jgi:hypothetical protein